MYVKAKRARILRLQLRLVKASHRSICRFYKYSLAYRNHILFTQIYLYDYLNNYSYSRGRQMFLIIDLEFFKRLFKEPILKTPGVKKPSAFHVQTSEPND